jgi:hypothetical protein
MFEVAYGLKALMDNKIDTLDLRGNRLVASFDSHTIQGNLSVIIEQLPYYLKLSNQIRLSLYLLSPVTNLLFPFRILTQYS